MKDIEEKLLAEISKNGTDKMIDLCLKWQERRIKGKRMFISKLEAFENNAALSNSNNSTLPDGFRIYKCTDCQEINVKKDNRQIAVGMCDKCEHPLWNDDVN